jgi:EAL domain-containing protein (putative c-di-GMP-specific phosphodiesterase class I)
MIGDLTFNLLRKACREALRWDPSQHISLNLSPVELHQDDLAQGLLNVLGETGFPAHRLEIELTEAALVSDLDAARATLMALKDEGVKIALDNFGVGHSTLRQLRELPFDKLKIDRSFEKRMTDDKEALVVLRTILAMARGLELEVIAEGVETAEQAKALALLGCNFGQGNLFGQAASSVPAPKRPRAEAGATDRAAKELAPAD